MSPAKSLFARSNTSSTIRIQLTTQGMIAMSDISRCLRVLSFLVVLLSIPAWTIADRTGECPVIAVDLIGDLRHHLGCIPPHLDIPELKANAASSISRMKASVIKPPTLPQWLEDLADHLLNSTLLVNNLNQDEMEDASNSSDCIGPCSSASPRCCRAESRLLFPLYGRSLTSGRLVRIAQDLDPNGIQQPVVYRHCLSTRAEWVRGRCHQSTLPRLFFVPTAGGYPYRQDLIMVPSNCECLVTVGDGRHNDDDDNDAVEWNKPSPTNSGTATTLSSTVEGSGTDVSGASEIEATLEEDGLFRHYQDS